MSAIAGLLSLAAGASNNELVSEFQTGILVRNSKGFNAGTSLFGLMSRLSNEPAENPTFNWFERNPVQRSVFSNGSALVGATSIVLDDNGTVAASVYGIVQVNTILLNVRTAEKIRVTAVTPGASSVTCTIERAYDGTAAAINDNDEWIVLTMGKDEGAAPAVAVFETADTLTYYVQTFNAAVNLTNAFKGAKLRTDIDGPLQERRVQALERVSRDIELAYFLGKAAVKTGTNGNVYFTGGLKNAVDAAVTSGANALNGGGAGGTALANVNAWLQAILTNGSDSKIMFAGPKTYAAFSTFANQGTNGFRITGTETVYGMNVQTINTPFGMLDLAMHPLFKEITNYQDWGFIVDLALVTQKVMEPLFLESNIQTPGTDAYQEQFRAKYGLKLKFAAAFGYAYSFSKIT